jgi:hypothetical protein
MRREQRVAYMIASAASSAAVDPLASLSDTFAGDELDGSWTLYEGDGTATLAVTGGELGFQIDAGSVGGSFWYEAEQGCLLYKLVDGDCECIATLRIRNTADSGLPPVTQFRLAGIAAHDPVRTALNYVHVALGAAGEADLRAEHKSTVNSVSEPGGGASPGYSSISLASGAGQIRLRREGQIFTCSVRATSGDPWTDIEVVDRTAAPLPSSLQWGPIVYAADSTHDIRGFFDSITFGAPS